MHVAISATDDVHVSEQSIEGVPDSSIARTHVHTEAISHRISFWQSVMTRLSVNERRRRFLHILPGLIPIIWILFPHEVPVSVAWRCGLAAIAFSGAALACYFGCAFTRGKESNCYCSTISYAVVGILPVLLFPAHPELSAAALAILAFGDGSAALGGMLLRGPTLPWNRDKTWAGLFCFLMGSIPFATFYLWAEAQPAMTVDSAFVCACSAASVGVIAESIPSKINDNIRVGSAAIAALLILEFLLQGWK
jgi:dolichol kinase